MKKFNLAALPLAVAGVLASTSALAGTEACFEVYTGADALEVSAFADIYSLAACGARGALPDSAILADNDSVAVAYELTGVDSNGDNVFGIDFDDIDNTAAATGDDQVIVYIPTTDIPGGTIIKMQLSGSNAEFAGNGNQIHLVKDIDGELDPGTTDGFEAVASSDGSFDGTSQITFITKAGVTIGAGTRLAFSQVSAGGVAADLEPISIALGNNVCTSADSSSSVTIEVTSAITDGGNGFNIEGAVSEKQIIADVSPQFYALQNGVTAEANVNAESIGALDEAIIARTEFVYDADATEQLVIQKQQVIYATDFFDRSPLLDRFVTLTVADTLDTKFVASAAPGSAVEMGLYNSQEAALNNSILDEQEEVEIGTTWGEIGLSVDTATEYETQTTMLFTPYEVNGATEINPMPITSNLNGALYNRMFYVVTNDRVAATDEVMNFNYAVDTNYTLDFGDTNLLDHCDQVKESHKIGVNGAVLKVPYATTASGNFVRITNEHDKSAEVTFDMFGESDNGTEEDRKVTALSLGTVPAQSSVVYFMTDILAVAQENGYVGADGGYAAGDLGSNFQSSNSRTTVTFTVTAPSDSVHGVSVQKVPGSVADRVLPVLDQNNWSQ